MKQPFALAEDCFFVRHFCSDGRHILCNLFCSDISVNAQKFLPGISGVGVHVVAQIISFNIPGTKGTEGRFEFISH